jgi:hypothetical protein
MFTSDFDTKKNSHFCNVFMGFIEYLLFPSTQQLRGMQMNVYIKVINL